MPGLFDILRKLGGGKLLENVIKTDKKLRDQTIMKAKNINIINLSYNEKTKPYVSELLEKKFGFYNEKLLPYDMEMISAAEAHKGVMYRLKRYLYPDDYNALICASTVIQLEDRRENKMAKQFRLSLSQRFVNRGSKIYNMLRSNYFENLILPTIDEIEILMEKETQDKKVEMFRSYFEQLLMYFPFAIWVIYPTSEKEIMEGIKERFEQPYVNLVCIYGRGKKNLNKIEKVCKNFLKDKKDYTSTKEDYGLRGTKAATFKIVRETKK